VRQKEETTKKAKRNHMANTQKIRKKTKRHEKDIFQINLSDLICLKL
jgi:hypothetical protein